MDWCLCWLPKSAAWYYVGVLHSSALLCLREAFWESKRNVACASSWKFWYFHMFAPFSVIFLGWRKSLFTFRHLGLGANIRRPCVSEVFCSVIYHGHLLWLCLGAHERKVLLDKFTSSWTTSSVSHCLNSCMRRASMLSFRFPLMLQGKVFEYKVKCQCILPLWGQISQNCS